MRKPKQIEVVFEGSASVRVDGKLWLVEAFVFGTPGFDIRTWDYPQEVHDKITAHVLRKRQ